MGHAGTPPILLVLATVVVGIQGTLNLDPCLDDRPPQSCYGVICFHGNCSSAFAIKDGHIVLVGRCTCINGWYGEQCDICDHISSTPVDNITSTSDGDTPITSQLSQPADTTGPDLVTTTSVIKYCAGLPLEQVIPSTCHGLACLHGRCHNVTRDDTEAYICDCDEGWTGIHCATCCDISCNQGSCQVDDDTEEMYCICHNNSYTSSSNCSEMIIDLPSENDLRHNWSWPVVGVALFLATCLVLIVVLLPYTMWKKRHHLMMKVVYLFQKYDDCERPFHVFISYRSSTDDEKFVIQKLHPQLEKMNLRVCVHYKDFIPGASIAENIIRAVENSSRTILVLSPDYCHGGWPRFEVQAAQKEMMNLRHRIVPIMFKDISQIRVAGNVDKLLEYILNTVTYIQVLETVARY